MASNRQLAMLEDLVSEWSRRLLASNNIYLIDDINVPKIARMLDGRLDQGESVGDAVCATINFYTTKQHVQAASPGMPELVAAVASWRTTCETAGEDASPDTDPARVAYVTRTVRKVFEKTYWVHMTATG